MASANCPFCDPGDRIVIENDLAVAIRDRHPASNGHTLVIPKRHCASFFDLRDDEVGACYALLREQQKHLDAENRPDGYNVGVNVGSAAGQTMEHTHLHLIPRYHGDGPDPRGGVRHVVPTRR